MKRTKKNTFAYLLKLRCIHIIAFLFLAILASNEVLAGMRFVKTENIAVCDDCDTRAGGQNTEERSMEEEHRLLSDAIIVPALLRVVFINKNLYIAPPVIAVNLGVLTPPPKREACY